jgi:peptidoglycan/LPS O-acetylase OafA/YrhL
VASVLWPRLGFREGFFWEIRDPLHYEGYLLAGLVAQRHEAWLRRLGRHPLPAAVACLAGLAVYAAAGPRALLPGPGPFYRALYTFSVVGLIALLTHARPASAAVRFLSSSSLAIYLYHFPFTILVSPATMALSPAVRIALRTAVALLGATLVCVAGARLLGTRARLLLGV